MTNAIQHFSHDAFGGLAIITVDGEPYFPAKDCALLLGYKDATNAIKRHCRHTLKRHLGVQTGVKADGTPAYQTVAKNYIPESDLYRLICRSKLPTGKQFESMVFDEALPSIRRHGAYLSPDTFDKILDDPEAFQALVQELARRNETPPRGSKAAVPMPVLPDGKSHTQEE